MSLRSHNSIVWTLLVAVSSGCAEGELASGRQALPPAANEPPVEQSTCGGPDACESGQTCVGGVCLWICQIDRDCPTGVCQPFGEDETGYCAESGLVEPQDRGAPAPPEPEVPEMAAPAPAPAPAPDNEEPPPLDKPPPDPADTPDEAPSPGPSEEPEGAVPQPPETEPEAEPEPEEVPEAPPAPPTAAPTAPPPLDCRYPNAGRQVQLGRPMPRFEWSNALDVDRRVVPFDLEAFHCDPEWSRYSVVAFVVGAGWCSACAEYLQTIAPAAADVEAAGGLFVFLEVETADYSTANSDDAFDIVRRHAGRAPGLRVGDADTEPVGSAMRDLDIVSSYPTAFVVRRSDMQVIYDQHQDAYTLDYVAIARSAGQGPLPGVDCTEEAGEPNDGQATATPLGDMWVAGGLCDDRPDFYRIDAPGAWVVDLQFSHRDGDLDLYLWDSQRGAPARNGVGRLIGSDSADDDERLQGSGPATIQVVGFEGARAAYRIQRSLE